MASTVPPVKGSAYTTYISLVSQSDTDLFQTSVTLAAGDVTVYQDGVLDGNIDTLPVETGTSGLLTVALSADEMDADTVQVRFRDAAGDEWQDALLTIHTVSTLFDTMSGALAAVLLDTGTDGVVLKAAGLAADAVTEIGTGVWDSSTRTLTQSAVSVASAVAGSTVTIHRGDSLSASITGLGNISTKTLLWFTVKDNLADADTASIIQIEATAGLVYLNGAAGTAGLGSITVDDATAGDITIALDETATDDLTPAQGLHYDVQWSDGTDVTTASTGPCNVTGDVTRSIS